MTTEERLQRLEKDLHAAKRNNRLLLVGAAAAAAVLFLLGASSGSAQSEVRALKFVLVDAAGRTSAQLHMTDAGHPELVVYDDNGTDRAGVCINDDGTPAVYVADPSRKYYSALKLDREGQPLVCVNSLSGMAMLKSWHEGGAGLQLYDKVDGKYVYSGSASLTRPTSSSQGRASGRSDEKYVAAKADYEKALAEWEGALERCDNMGIGADEINRLAANSRWADLLGTLGTMNKQEAARKALVAKERLERAKARLEALDWKE